MATYHEKLAESLSKLRQVQKGGKRVFRSAELSRVHRERLEKAGYVAPIIKGWLTSTSPDAQPGDTTPWYSSFWEFCGRYCTHRFARSWYLSPEQSLLIHAENWDIPNQLIVHAAKGQSNLLKLPFDTRLIDLKASGKVRVKDVAVVDGIRVLPLATALSMVAPSFYRNNQAEAVSLLGAVKDASVVLPSLLEAGKTTVAGTLAGAFEHVGRRDVAEEICAAMKAAGHVVSKSNPFQGQFAGAVPVSVTSPLIGRIGTLWDRARSVVLEVLPGREPLVTDVSGYLKDVDEAYTHDAYHSLSIEGYQVSEELIRRVASGSWRPEESVRDRDDRNALAARGYWECFQLVKADVKEVLSGEPAGALARREHRAWYRALFAPNVKAGLSDSAALAGYRHQPVFIRRSRHVPVRWESIPDAMEGLFRKLEDETSPVVSAVLGHWLFGYIHPYVDGNGRMARFLMNLMLASGGYPWTTITVDDRDEYMAALEAASVDGDIEPFARFIADHIVVA